ncbi:MAG TPA: hypothetical protein VKU02_21125 [Gemmataceae bacterium]|nr:hypothetical protein [Gemmataceae bacterium]
MESVVCPTNPDYGFEFVRRSYSDPIQIPSSGHIFRSQTLRLSWTIEMIWLPHRSWLAARVEGQSSLARLDIGVHVTAPTIHAGFGYKMDEGYPGSPLPLEMWNVGPLDVKLEAGMRVCQRIFEMVDGAPEKGYEGKFSIQGPTPPS